MKEKIKTQKGFIQIPLLIAIIVAIIVVSGIGIGVILYNQGKLFSFLKSPEPFNEETQKKIAELEQKIKKLEEKQQTPPQTQQDKEPQTLQVSLSFIAQRVVFLHCLQVGGTKSYIRSLYDVPVYEPNFEG